MRPNSTTAINSIGAVTNTTRDISGEVEKDWSELGIDVKRIIKK